MPCDLKSMLGGSKSLDIWDRDSMPDRVVMFTSLILRRLVASEPLPPSGLSSGEVSPQSEAEHCPGRAPVSAWWWDVPLCWDTWLGLHQALLQTVTTVVKGNSGPHLTVALRWLPVTELVPPGLAVWGISQALWPGSWCHGPNCPCCC